MFRKRNRTTGTQYYLAGRNREATGAGLFASKIMVDELEHAVLFRDGRIEQVLPPGMHRLRPNRDRIVFQSAVPQSLAIRSQEILTSDGVTARATVSVIVQIHDPVVALRSGNWNEQLHLALQLALRAEVTNRTLEELITARSEVDEPLLAATKLAAEPLGVTVSSLALRDLVVPGEQRALLAQVVNAQLAGRAALERARAETAAVRSLANAASMMNDNPALYQLRLLQEMSNTKGNTFIVGTDPSSLPTQP